jgi:hypothetical protein
MASMNTLPNLQQECLRCAWCALTAHHHRLLAQPGDLPSLAAANVTGDGGVAGPRVPSARPPAVAPLDPRLRWSNQPPSSPSILLDPAPMRNPNGVHQDVVPRTGQSFSRPLHHNTHFVLFAVVPRWYQLVHATTNRICEDNYLQFLPLLGNNLIVLMHILQ